MNLEGFSLDIRIHNKLRAPLRAQCESRHGFRDPPAVHCGVIVGRARRQQKQKTAKANQGGKCQLLADRRQREKPQRLRPGLWNSRQGLSHLSVLQPDPAMRILPLQYDSQMAKSPDRFRSGLYWLRGPDLNQRPSGYEPDELPDCSTSRYSASGASHLS